MSGNELMLAAVHEEGGKVRVKEIPKPRVESAVDILIKIEASGICGSDIITLSNPSEYGLNDNIVVGHEFTGIVKEVGTDVKRVQVGDRVVIHPNLACGNCYYCQIGMSNQCADFYHCGYRLPGGMAEYCVIPEKLVYTISKKVPPHIACLAEPLACVLNGTDLVRIHPGESAVVLGAGPIGMLFGMIYKAAGAVVFISDISEKRLELAKKIGVDYIFNSNEINIVDEVMSSTLIGADIVTDTVGILLKQALKIIKRGGHIMLFGLNQNVNVEFNQTDIVYNSVNVHGVYIAKGTFPLAVRLIEIGKLPLDILVTHRLPLSDIKKGIELMQKGEAVKVVIEP